LGFLGIGKFCISLFQNLLQIIDFFYFSIKLIAECELGFFGLLCRDSGLLLPELLGQLLVQGLFLLLQGCFVFMESLLAFRYVSVSFCARRCS